MMATPSFLIAEMRHAFRTCAQFRRHQHGLYRTFSSTVVQLKSLPPPPRSRRVPGKQQEQWPYNGALPPQKSTAQDQQVQGQQATADSTDLVPKSKSRTDVGASMSDDVPMRVIPKPDLAPGVSMSPRERLHVEVMTRRTLPRAEKQPIFKERLQIYHIGNAKERVIILCKQFTLVSLCAGLFVYAPAQLTAGVALPTVALCFAVATMPLAFIHHYFTPMATRVFLRLPTKARETSKTAMEYAKNLPRDVELEIEYLQPWALPKLIKAKVSDLIPQQSQSWLKRNFTVSWNTTANARPRYSPRGFYLQPHSATGAASKNTIPGLWESVYQRLVTRTNGISPGDRWSLLSDARASARTVK